MCASQKAWRPVLLHGHIYCNWKSLCSLNHMRIISKFSKLKDLSTLDQPSWIVCCTEGTESLALLHYMCARQSAIALQKPSGKAKSQRQNRPAGKGPCSVAKSALRVCRRYTGWGVASKVSCTTPALIPLMLWYLLIPYSCSWPASEKNFRKCSGTSSSCCSWFQSRSWYAPLLLLPPNGDSPLLQPVLCWFDCFIWQISTLHSWGVRIHGYHALARLQLMSQRAQLSLLCLQWHWWHLTLFNGLWSCPL